MPSGTSLKFLSSICAIVIGRYLRLYTSSKSALKLAMVREYRPFFSPPMTWYSSTGILPILFAGSLPLAVSALAALRSPAPLVAMAPAAESGVLFAWAVAAESPGAPFFPLPEHAVAIATHVTNDTTRNVMESTGVGLLSDRLLRRRGVLSRR